MMLLAQEMPDPSLLQGSTQQVMAWVILAMVALHCATVVYFIRKHSNLEAKYDALLVKTMKLAVRAQRAIEYIAHLPEPEVEEDIEGDEHDGK